MVHRTLSIPEQLVEKTVRFGESSFGTTRVTLVLADQRRIPEVVLAWGRDVVKVGGKVVSRPDELDFRTDEIVDVIPEIR